MKEHEKSQDQSASELLQLTSFKIGEEEFGVNILEVQEIIRMVNITKLPHSPSYIDGVINLRGKIIPVMNLRSRLNLNKKVYDDNTRIIVVELGGKIIGFTVDEVNEVLRIPRNITEAPPEIVAGINSKYITAIGKLDDRLLILLDLNKIVSVEEEAETFSIAS